MSDVKRNINTRLKKALPLLVVLAGIAAVALLATFVPARVKDEHPSAPAPVNVRILEIKPLETLADTFVLQGVVRPNREVDVAAEVVGQIESYGTHSGDVLWQGRQIRKGDVIREGEPVVAGDLLIELNRDLLQAEYNRARAQNLFDRRDVERLQRLFDSNVATQSELDTARTQMELSEAFLEAARKRLERTSIRAPISGILNDLEEIGTFVQAGTRAAQIVDIDRAKVTTQVPERDINYLHLGDKVQIIVDPTGQTQIEGTITYIDELADAATRTTTVDVTVDNPPRNASGRLLRSGQIVRAVMTRSILRDVVMIPLASAVPVPQSDGGTRYVVYVLGPATDEQKQAQADAQAQRREIQIGLIRGTQVQVLGDALRDQRLILDPRYVGPGQAVKIIERAQPVVPATTPAELLAEAVDGSER